MSTDQQPEIAGPGAAHIQAVSDATGYAGDEPVLEAVPAPTQEQAPDPAFPFGTPANIDWTKIDPVGVNLLQELNQRVWIQSTEYCSGHPLNRPVEEYSELYPMVSGENVYEEITRLDLAFVRGLVPDVYFRYRKQQLRQQGITRFYLNVNVYNIAIFQEWVRFLSTILTMATNSTINPLIVRFNPLRAGMNYSIYWDYWTVEERQLIHALVYDSLMQFPV